MQLQELLGLFVRLLYNLKNIVSIAVVPEINSPLPPKFVCSNVANNFPCIFKILWLLQGDFQICGVERKSNELPI